MINHELKIVSFINGSFTMYRVHSPKACKYRWLIFQFKIISTESKVREWCHQIRTVLGLVFHVCTFEHGPSITSETQDCLFWMMFR